jgi:hypothetical protein
LRKWSETTIEVNDIKNLENANDLDLNLTNHSNTNAMHHLSPIHQNDPNLKHRIARTAQHSEVSKEFKSLFLKSFIRFFHFDPIVG